MSYLKNLGTGANDYDVLNPDDLPQYLNDKADKSSTYTKTEVDELIAASGSGLTYAAKQALLQIASKVAYTDAHGQDYYNALYDALYAVTAIRLNTNTITLNRLGATSQLTATTVPAGGRVEWTSSNPAVATVSANGLVTSVGYGSAVITATSGSVSATCAVTVEQLVAVSLDAVYTQSGRVLDTDSLDSLKADLVVTVGWSDGTSTVVPSADCVLSGTLAIGTSTVTVTYAGLTDTFTVTVDGLVSIFATYTQSGDVYDTDSLDSLKTDLVVTGVYNSGTSTPITDYTLSGTLAVGTSTITVTYLSFTDDFDVTVSVSDVLYKLPQATTFNGTSDFIDTGVALNETDIDFTIMVDFTLPSIPSGTQEVLHCMHEASPYPGTVVEVKNNKLRTGVNGALEDNALSSLTYPATIRVVITHELATGNNTCYRLFGTSYKIDVKTSAITPITENLLLGAYQATDGTKGRYFNGTINRCEIYSSVKSQSAIEHFLGLDAPVQSLAVTYTSSNPVVEGMDLNWLKADMVVTATLTSGVSHTVSPADYTLSGTLAEGTSQVTATYQGVSSSPISVTVGAEGPLYQLPQATTFDGVDDYLDTGLAINSIDRDFTVCLDINQFGRTNSDRDAISLRAYENPYYGMTINCNTSTAIYKSAGKGNVDIYRMYESTHEKFVITHEADSDICTIYRYDSGMNFKAIEAGYNVPNDIAYIVVGARRGRNNTYSKFYDGTINACAIYGRVLEQTEIESYVAPTIYPDSTPTLLYQLPQAATFDGTASSGIAIPEANIVEYDMNYTIMFDAVSSGSGHYVFGISGASDGINRRLGLTFWLGDDMAIDGYNKSTKIIQSGTSGKRVKGVITHVKSEEFVTLSYIYDGNPVATAVTVTGAYTPVQRVMTLGAKLNDSGYDFSGIDPMTGTIYDFKVYRGLVSQTDIDAYLA